MFQHLRKIFFAILYFTGIGHLLKYYNTRKFFAPILLFHRVSDHLDPYWPPLAPHAFKNIIQFFSKKYSVRPIKDLFNNPADSLKGSCFIVFDDAYRDFLENALPFLMEKNIPVTMFVPVESINISEPIWTTWLNMCIDQAKIRTIHITELPIVYDISNKQSKIKTAHSLTVWLKSLPYQKFKSCFDEIIAQTGQDIKRSDIGVMNWSEIAVTGNHVDYQSHTMTHPMLGNIEKEEILDYEIGHSKKVMEQELKRKVQYISYPIGSYSPAVMEKSRAYYDAAFAVDGRQVDLKKIDDIQYKYKIPRFNISDSDPYELFFRVNGFHKLFGR